MSKNYSKVASKILEVLGGKENLVSAAHCATRLRVVLSNQELVDEKKLESIELVKGSFLNGGQFQIILGAGIVDEVYAEFIKLSGLNETSKEELKKVADTKLNPLQRILKSLADIFVPIIPAIVAGGLLMGINNILTSQGLFIEGVSLIEAYPQIADLASLINTFANTAFVFLPVLIGFSAAKIFGANQYLGAVIAMLMVHPDLLNGWGYGASLFEGTIPSWNILGLTIEKVGYQGTVFPVLAAIYILAKVEKSLRKVIPSVLDNLLTPLFSVFITGILTFVVVGPIMRGAGNLLTDGIMFLYNSLGPIGGAIFGGVYGPVVVTGMHHSFMAVETQLLADMTLTGGTFIFVVAAMSNIAQGASALAVFFINKDTKMKGVASASGISALLGITEPAMFGVNLKLRYPFYAAMIGAAVSTAYTTFANVLAVSQGPAGLPGIIAIRPQSMVQYIIGMAISFAVAFVMTIVLSKMNKFNKEVEAA
ncbi:PTS sucrose transporter subunit IIBC [Clostridium sp. NSJ-6]|uniref:protein-N(pi)-phosphohistidine--sucrose phosphotransferase n=1 Tax=Clostridium hominis TaxID=2763036 RepID=A0ABR7DAF4_9CLOT|nr:sucrose-specific PTS transporter subunit IIBC [Clostridium hominis]MBC5628130.1 PTS sucrose transporter subunit IIBC [Clostridium hominis]